MKNRFNMQQGRAEVLLILLSFLLLSAADAFASGPYSFADLAEKQALTVVNVSTTQTVKASLMPEFPFHDQEIPEFFKRFFGVPHHPQMQQQERKMTSLGSGVIISKDGYILTNNHVIDEADEIRVRFASQEEFDAKIIGRDPKTDLALIKISSPFCDEVVASDSR